MGGTMSSEPDYERAAAQQAPATKALLNIVVLLAVVLPLVIVRRFLA
jgi:hypothetical protein